MGFHIDEETIKSSLIISKNNMLKAFPIIKENLLKEEEFKRVDRFEELINAMRWD